jgi:outer membrane PBP1 activator LpoA protein
MPRLPLLPPLMLCVLLSGCVELEPADQLPPPEVTAAERMYQQGDFDGAAQGFLDLASAHSSERDHYRLRAAEAYREEGNLDAAAQALSGVKTRRLTGEEVTRYALLDAEIALAHNEPARALERLSFAEESVPPPLRLRTLELRARAQAANGDAIGSARTRMALDRYLGGNDRAQNEKQLVDTLRAVGPEKLKQQATALPPNDPLTPWVNQALHASGQALPQVVLRPGEPVGTLMPGGQSNAVAREGYRPSRRIAVLLPTAGPLKAVAQPIRDGFFAAYFADTNPERPEVRTYDSGDTPQQAVDAYQRAVAEGAERIVGPLRRDAVSAVFAQGALPVPILTLNQPEHGTAPPGSAAFGLNPDSEAAQAAEHLLERGIRSAVIITATDEWAERAALAFRAQLENHNGEVLGDARIKEGEINYAAQIRQALAAVHASSAAPPLPGAAPSTAVPEAPAVGIFISMRPQQARLLMPQIKLAGYNGVPVVATSHIYSGNADPGQDRDLDGVEFCDAPWLFDVASGVPLYSEMSRVLDSVRGAGARLFALGLDAYSLLPYLEWLSQHHEAYLPGATGQLSEDELDRIQRLLVWARFEGGIARPINGGLVLSPGAP